MPNPIDYGITEEEFAVILRDLGREPNHIEMGIYSAMWSEHCSYKHTKPLLKQLPTQSDRVVQGPGENAGVIAINKDWNLVFKIESHNHPSYIAPYDGAATGVGGLLRDIMAMGARPLGVKALLRFGDTSYPATAKLVSEIRKGATDYANGCDVARLGEEIFTHKSYTTNPLVNVIVLGIAKSDALMQSSAGKPGNQFVYFGRPTGTDGVNGASFASQGIDEDTKANPPAGDAKLGKDLMEATLRLIESGLIVGLQDMGAAGLTSSSFEMAHKADCGFEMHLDNLPKTDENISGYELMLSETQERMLASVDPENVPAVLRILSEFPLLSSQVIGQITEEKKAIITQHGQVVVDLPIESVADGYIRYQINGKPTQVVVDPDAKLIAEVDGNASIVVRTIENQQLLNASALKFESIDQKFGPCSFIGLPDIKKAILLRTLANGTDILADPYQSVYQVIKQAYLDLQAQGAQPIAISDCINSGDPDDPQTAYEIIEGLRGMADACRDFDLPVIGGNVSLYNATNNKAILSQFMIGMVGIMDWEGEI